MTRRFTWRILPVTVKSIREEMQQDYSHALFSIQRMRWLAEELSKLPAEGTTTQSGPRQ